MTNARHIGDAVLFLRSVYGWTQAELATKAGLHRRTIQDIELGLTSPRLATRIRLARAFGVPLDRLMVTNANGGTAA